MIIWLRHPRHGVKPCYSVSEARADVTNGWERFDPAEAAEERLATQAQSDASTAAVVEEVAQAPAPVADVPKKRGRPARNQG